MVFFFSSDQIFAKLKFADDKEELTAAFAEGVLHQVVKRIYGSEAEEALHCQVVGVDPATKLVFVKTNTKHVLWLRIGAFCTNKYRVLRVAAFLDRIATTL